MTTSIHARIPPFPRNIDSVKTRSKIQNQLCLPKTNYTTDKSGTCEVAAFGADEDRGGVMLRKKLEEVAVGRWDPVAVGDPDVELLEAHGY